MIADLARLVGVSPAAVVNALKRADQYEDPTLRPPAPLYPVEEVGRRLYDPAAFTAWWAKRPGRGHRPARHAG